jgi:vacuolar-type H+-ATPase subunit C/Vma6
VLAGALQAAGYWPAPSQGGGAPSAVATIDAAIEHRVSQQLDVLARWLGDRRRHFAAIFEYEERRASRFWLRRLFSVSEERAARQLAPGAAGLPRRLRDEAFRATRVDELVRALQRADNPYAAPLAAALRNHGEELDSLEGALDHAFAARALRAADRFGGRLLGWVRDGIDLENAWAALAGAGESFVQGGHQLSEAQHAAVAHEEIVARRRHRLEQIFAPSPLARVFDDPMTPAAALESRARMVRIANERRATRIDPLAEAPILEFVMRLRAERADLRRINWGIAQGRAAEVIIDQMSRRP